MLGKYLYGGLILNTFEEQQTMSVQYQLVKTETTPNPITNNKPQLSVYVANLGKYNQGELVGGWLNIPATQTTIKAFLRDVVGINAEYEEYAVHDTDSEFTIGEHENLYQLNMLAVKLEQMTPAEKQLAAAYCGANGIRHTIGILNICEQLYELNTAMLEEVTGNNREEKLGYLTAQQNGLEDELEQVPLNGNISAAAYFDYESYGRDLAISDGYFIAEDIFVFYGNEPDPELYSADELREQLDDPRLTEEA